ncbi:MAG: FHA domain-containing protein [Deltaproteobacteria bacterium]|nr:FHA domain-containing protein [Deltaproteobacteria bacterium]
MSATSTSKGSTRENRLVGWLISYEMDSKGKSFEIRAGRSLLSSDNGQDKRIITVREQSISAPHVALSASPRHKVMVQDIFSEFGTFLTKGASGKEQEVQGPTELEHGDWLRIGDKTRLQVCLIDGPRR